MPSSGERRFTEHLSTQFLAVLHHLLMDCTSAASCKYTSLALTCCADMLQGATAVRHRPVRGLPRQRRMVEPDVRQLQHPEREASSCPVQM